MGSLRIDSTDIAELNSAFERTENPVIVTHARPDGDALGSALGLYRYLKDKRGKDAKIVLPDRYPDSLAFAVKPEDAVIAWSETPERGIGAIAGADFIFCLDFNNFSRTEGMAEALAGAGAFKVLIDHHLYPEVEKFGLVFSRIEISSTSELLYYILLEMPDIQGDAALLPKHSGEALMTGMTTDTNNFANSVFPSTFGMASALLAAGIDRNAIVENIYNHYRENRIRALGYLLGKKLKIMENGVAYMIIDKHTACKYDLHEGETEGFVNMPLAIGDVVMSLLAKQDEDRYRISIRSKSGVSANKFASAYFNGGGHEQASGGKLIFGKDIAKNTAALEKYIEKAAMEFMTGSER